MIATVNIMPDGPVERVVEVAQQAEAAGFGAAWIFDEGVVTRDVYVTLTAVALATETIAIGTGITNPYTRHPAVTANAIATLDELSGRRAFVGIGAGGGLTLDPLRLERVRPLVSVREAVEVLRALFGGSAVDYDGETVALSGAALEHARDDIEIWFAGRGPRMLAQAGALCDGVHLSYVHKSTIGPSARRVRDAATGRRPKLSLATALVTNDRELAHAKTQLSFRLVDSPQDVKDRLGLGPDDIAAIRSSLAEGGPPVAARHVRDEWVAEFTIMGSHDECAAELSSLMDEHAIDEFQVPVLRLDEAEDTLATAGRVLAAM